MISKRVRLISNTCISYRTQKRAVQSVVASTELAFSRLLVLDCQIALYEHVPNLRARVVRIFVGNG